MRRVAVAVFEDGSGPGDLGMGFGLGGWATWAALDSREADVFEVRSLDHSH